MLSFWAVVRRVGTRFWWFGVSLLLFYYKVQTDGIQFFYYHCLNFCFNIHIQINIYNQIIRYVDNLKLITNFPGTVGVFQASWSILTTAASSRSIFLQITILDLSSCSRKYGIKSCLSTLSTFPSKLWSTFILKK